MARILTGIQSTGRPHLGNILGAIKPAIELANEANNDSFLFIADLHSLTQLKDKETLKNNTFQVAATWLACGLDPNKTTFYRQSDVVECTELAWYLNCYFPYQRLKLAHSFKDKSDRLEDVNSGLFAYPMLMASDILLYDADFVPVGKDQLQHLEMTRDVASRINHKHGEIFVLPEPILQQDAQLILGTDGEKMSKSRNNTIDVFDTENAIKKLINKNIITDNTPLEEPKDPNSATVYQLYKLLASDEEAKTMSDKLKAGGYGWGHAKKELLEKVVSSFSEERAKFEHYQNNPKEVEEVLMEGAQKAKKVAKATLERVRISLGYN
ncbi:MAG: tryptophan--tRNA ligase [Bacteroidota bacterium]|nr:tryptophan--tRNA ligase [Bacteroidota bacterium]